MGLHINQKIFLMPSARSGNPKKQKNWLSGPRSLDRLGHKMQFPCFIPGESLNASAAYNNNCSCQSLTVGMLLGRWKGGGKQGGKHFICMDIVCILYITAWVNFLGGILNDL